MKSLTSFTINVAKVNKRKVGKVKIKLVDFVKGIVVKEDGEYQVRINTLDDPNNPSFITIPFTFDSYEVKDREFVFERNNTSNNKYICHVRDKYKAKVFPGSKKQYIPFYKNVIVCGNIVKILGRLHFQFKDLIAFSPTSIPIHDYNIDESKPLLKMNILPVSQANGKSAISILNFTKDQTKAYNELIGFINAPYNENDYKRALVGAAGTGKTYLVKALIQNSNMSYSTIGLAAPTHKACRVLDESINIKNINVNTLQSDLGLRLNFDVEQFDINNPPFDPKGRIKIGDYKLYIVDESSMINKGLHSFLEKVCKSNNCKIIYIGDDSQLAPVKETYSSAFANIKTSVLKEIVRQGDDNPVSYLLDLLRYDIKHKSYTFLEYITKHRNVINQDNTKGFVVCNTLEFNKAIFNNFTDSQITNDIDFARIVAYTNNKVSYWNKLVRTAIIKDSDKSIITKNDLIISYTTLVDNFNDCIIKNSEEYILKDVVNYTHPKYNIKGFMVRFIAIHGGKISTPLFIIDHTDKFSINMYVKTSRELINAAKNANSSVRSSRWKEYYKFKESCLLLTNIINRQGTIEFSRDLDYGFALTAHKS